MSRAFTKESDEGDPILVAPRAPLPDGVPNYVTPRGLSLLQAEMSDLESRRASLPARSRDERDRRRELAALATRVAQLGERIASAIVVEPGETDVVRFGATVRVRDEGGAERSYRIVGVDEADPASGAVAFTSPIARALMGAAVGDEATVRTPRGDQVLEILDIT